jgi:hypothetical protein
MFRQEEWIAARYSYCANSAGSGGFVDQFSDR